MGNCLLVARDEISGRVARFDYDEFDNLIAAEYERNGEIERLYRVPDRMGTSSRHANVSTGVMMPAGGLPKTENISTTTTARATSCSRSSRKWRCAAASSPLSIKERLESELGIRLRAFGTGWRYDWQSDGMLARVVRPDGKEVSFAYDALGRRIRKSFAGTTTHFVWDGNVPLHEWTEENEMVTWLFEQDTFVPAAKLVANGECFSIVSDYLGTPLQAYDKRGNKVWEQELDIYGRQRKRPSAFIPFKYQGQYEDAETGLYYNRFRYYDPNAGSYISQDPIGLNGGLLLFGYVSDINLLVDVFGLVETRNFTNFDAAREEAFRIASGGDPSVTFTPTKVDVVTGTEVEFKGSNGSKIVYDAAHLDMDKTKGHHKPHVGVQTGGKRNQGGTQRWNLTYDGETHPHRSNVKGEGNLH